jgi:hypothetical protein
MRSLVRAERAQCIVKFYTERTTQADPGQYALAE